MLRLVSGNLGGHVTCVTKETCNVKATLLGGDSMAVRGSGGRGDGVMVARGSGRRSNGATALGSYAFAHTLLSAPRGLKWS